jgi:hypothetical protein
VDAGWVAAIASVASAFVVGVAAIAAVRQIRHIRNANEITTYLHLVDRLETANAVEVFASMEEFARKVQTDRSLRYRLAQRPPVPEFQGIETLLWFLDSLSMLMLTGSIAERLVLNKYAYEILRMWETLGETVYLRRCAVPYFGSTYEHLAMRAKAHVEAGEIAGFYGRLERDPRLAGVKAPDAPQ